MVHQLSPDTLRRIEREKGARFNRILLFCPRDLVPKLKARLRKIPPLHLISKDEPGSLYQC
jgi:hypothetical protein